MRPVPIASVGDIEEHLDVRAGFADAIRVARSARSWPNANTDAVIAFWDTQRISSVATAVIACIGDDVACYGVRYVNRGAVVGITLLKVVDKEAQVFQGVLEWGRVCVRVCKGHGAGKAKNRGEDQDGREVHSVGFRWW